MSDFSSEDEAHTKEKAVGKIREELDSASEESGSENSEDDSDESQIKVDFSSKQGKPETKKQAGLMSLKFMQKAEQRKKEALKVQAEMVIKQINGEDDYQSS